MNLKERIREAINCASAENGSDTPDFILAEYLTDCLAAFDKAIVARQTRLRISRTIRTNRETSLVINEAEEQK